MTQVLRDDDDVEGRPMWDAEIALVLPGKRVLVGITRHGADGVVLDRQQFCGTVESAHQRSGILMTLEGSRLGES